jgi:hypothetical protein
MRLVMMYLTLLAPFLAPRPATVTVVATDYAFQLPDSIPSGVTTFNFKNTGAEPHELVLLKLAPGQTMADVLKAAQKDGPNPLWAAQVGGPGGTFPGAATRVTLRLQPGQYAVFCGVPGKDGVPHLMKGMIKTLTVTSGGSTAPEPTSDVTITMVDFDFTLSKPLTAGPHTIRVVNAGSQEHMLQLIRLTPGVTLDGLLTAMRDHHQPLPIAWTTGASAMGKGDVAYVDATLAPGSYGLLCFLDDDTDGKPHFAHGMRKEFTVQ